MSIHESSASAPVLPTTSLAIPKRNRAAISANRCPSAAGPWGTFVVLSGLGIATFGTLWATELDVPYPLVMMAAYCTLVASACLYTALLILRKLSTKSEPVSTTRSQPNYAAWKLMSKYSVSDASRLWCDIEPGCPASQESIAWAHALLDAVKRGELSIVPRSGSSEAMRGPEQANPTWHTEVARKALQSWAQSHEHSPRFLQE